jgi:hypothetical protein
MSVLGGCWHRKNLGRVKEVLRESKQCRKIGSAPEIEEKKHQKKDEKKR